MFDKPPHVSAMGVGGQEAEHQFSDLVILLVHREMACIEQVDFSMGQVSGAAAAGRPEKSAPIPIAASFGFIMAVPLDAVHRSDHLDDDAREASSSVTDAASRTRSFSRNWPMSPEMAGKPPSEGTKTPGVVMKKVSVIR